MTDLTSVTYNGQYQLLSILWSRLSVRRPGALDSIGKEYSSFRAWTEFEERRSRNSSDLRQLSAYQSARGEAVFSEPDGVIGAQISKRVNSLAPWSTEYRNHSAEDFERLSSLEKARDASFLKYRESEINSYLGGDQPDFNTDFFTFYSKKLAGAFSQCGFRPDSERSVEGIPVVSKRLLSNWDLCWAVETARSLREWPRAQSIDVARWNLIAPILYCCRAQKKRSPVRRIGAVDPNIVDIRLGQLVVGFDWAYRQVNGWAQSGFCLGAYAALYTYFQDELEVVLSDMLI